MCYCTPAKYPCRWCAFNGGMFSGAEMVTLRDDNARLRWNCPARSRSYIDSAARSRSARKPPAGLRDSPPGNVSRRFRRPVRLTTADRSFSSTVRFGFVVGIENPHRVYLDVGFAHRGFNLALGIPVSGYRPRPTGSQSPCGDSSRFSSVAATCESRPAAKSAPVPVSAECACRSPPESRVNGIASLGRSLNSIRKNSSSSFDILKNAAAASEDFWILFRMLPLVSNSSPIESGASSLEKFEIFCSTLSSHR